jgi:hypothetical protein
MQYRIYLVAALLLFFHTSCTKFEDAEMTRRNTFVHFYSSATDYLGVVAELDSDGGYILTGEIRNDNGTSSSLIIKTDVRGHKLWEKIIPNGIMNAIKTTQNGYILLGDSIQLNPGSPEVNELVNTYARLLLMDTQGNILGQHITSGTVRRTVSNQPVDLNIDYHGNALTVDAAGNIIILGSFRIPGENEASFVASYDPSDISDSLWYRSYTSLDHDYINCNALHVTPGSELIWASKTFTQQQNVSREYLSISYVVPNSTYKNNSIYGESDARNHSVEDIQKSSVGYAAIGTYSETSGLNANMYFIRIDVNGNVVQESARYIDGEELMLNNHIMEFDSKTASSSFDEGQALTATSDGYVLAGTMTSTPTVGNGGKDILLVKLDAFGNLVWKKLIGGSGDEAVSSIRETPDGGLLVCGTNTINGLSTMMLMKTDSNGNLDK